MNEDILKQILNEMKDMKTDMHDMKSDINDLKSEMNNMKSEMSNMKADMNNRFTNVDMALERIENQNHEDVLGMLKVINNKMDKEDNEVLAINRRLHRVEGVVEGLSKQ